MSPIVFESIISLLTNLRLWNAHTAKQAMDLSKTSGSKTRWVNTRNMVKIKISTKIGLRIGLYWYIAMTKSTVEASSIIAEL